MPLYLSGIHNEGVSCKLWQLQEGDWAIGVKIYLFRHCRSITCHIGIDPVLFHTWKSNNKRAIRETHIASTAHALIQCFLTACQLCTSGKTKGEARHIQRLNWGVASLLCPTEAPREYKNIAVCMFSLFSFLMSVRFIPCQDCAVLLKTLNA